jgi:hypothetical protein
MKQAVYLKAVDPESRTLFERRRLLADPLDDVVAAYFRARRRKASIRASLGGGRCI